MAQRPNVAIGDSTVYGALGEAAFSDYLSWLVGYPVLNKGVVGNHLHDVAARMPTDLLTLRPPAGILLCATNDIAAGDSEATLEANLDADVAAMRAGGVYPIIGSVLPRADADYKAKIIAYNSFLATYAPAHGALYVDTYSAFDAGGGVPRAGYLAADNLHPSRDLGRRVLAETFAAAFPAMGAWSPRNGSALYGPGNFAVDTNADGLADGLVQEKSAGATQTNSLSAHETDGKWQKVAKTGGATGSDYVSIKTADLIVGGYGVSALSTYDISFDLKTNAALAGCYVDCKVFSQNAAWGALANQYITPNIYAPLATSTRVFGTVTIPATAAHAYVMFTLWGAGNSDFSIGRLTIKKRLPNPIAGPLLAARVI